MLSSIEADRQQSHVSGPTSNTVLLVLGSLLLVVLIGPLMALSPIVGLGALAGIVIFGTVVSEPALAAYYFLGFTPLLAGFERGSVLPVIRPTEALLVLLFLAVSTRSLSDGLQHRLPQYVISRLDKTIFAMAVLSSIVPLFWRVGRGYGLTRDDLLFSTTLWKYFLVFALFRLVVRSVVEVRRCLLTMVGVGTIVGIVAILQSLSVPGFPALVATIYGESLDSIDNNRGSSTLGTSHGVADIMAFDLAISAAMLMRGQGSRWIWGPLVGLFGLASFASGQFSAFFAVIVVVVVLGVLGGRMLATMGLAVPGIVLSLVVLKPVLDARFASTNDSGVPSSWDARIFNLENYFWPDLFSGANFVLGVRPAGRLPSYEPWREWVYIESGHTWLLWTGGIPLFLAFLWFCWIAIGAAHGLSRQQGLPGVIGISVASALWVIFVLMTLDVHLTMRGPADALFPLLAILIAAQTWGDDNTLARASAEVVV